jgi:hypothetical protein
MMAGARAAIEQGAYRDFKSDFLGRYGSSGGEEE